MTLSITSIIVGVKINGHQLTYATGAGCVRCCTGGMTLTTSAGMTTIRRGGTARVDETPTRRGSSVTGSPFKHCTVAPFYSYAVGQKLHNFAITLSNCSN